MAPSIVERLDTALVEDSADGLFRCDRAIFTDAGFFELEMRYLFEGNWVYLAHESQIPNKNDYFTTWMGRQPIFIARSKDNELNAFINACSHRGAMLCRYKRGSKSTFTCPFHGWTFSNSGKLLKVKDPDGAGYPEQFHNEGSHDLKKVARFEAYRGFLFGSLNPDVKPLAEHLREAIESDGDKLADLHLWRLGPGHLGAILSVITAKARGPDFYRAQLARFHALSHVTIEIEHPAS